MLEFIIEHLMTVVVLPYGMLFTSSTVTQDIISNILVYSTIILVMITLSNPAGAKLGPAQLQRVILTFQIIKARFNLIPSVDILQSDLIGRSCLSLDFLTFQKKVFKQDAYS